MRKNVSNLKDITVLYCEDEEYLRDVTKGVLESFTKNQFIAEDGAIGFELFKKHENEIDLIITDVNMPNMNGLEMAKAIKELNPNIPIIVATAFSNSEYLLEAIEIGIDKYVLKPINIKKLLDTMNQSLLYHELRDLYSDTLTNLPNRNALLKDLNNDNLSILILVDIDNFSVLNDLYGEENGDNILIQFSNKIKDYFTSSYKMYRAGSDKFIVLYNGEDTNAIDNFKELSNELLININSLGLNVNDNIIDLNITIGMAQSNDSHAFEYAQRAVQKARKSYVPFMEYNELLFEQKEDFQNNISWIKKIKDGITNNYFQPYFQPIIDADTQKVYKYEALIRYIELDGTEVLPYKFLPIAKKAKLFPIIIRIMLTNIIKIIKEKNIRIAVNISFDDIANPNTLDFIFDTLKNNKEITHFLDFEILESEEIEDFELVKNFIDKIKAFGCNVGIDDFGAGYANFNMLSAWDIDYVKIDGSLIKEIDCIPKQALIVETISQFCKKIGVKTVAEFVSSESIYLTSKKLGIDYMQGWYFGKAVSLDNI